MHGFLTKKEEEKEDFIMKKKKSKHFYSIALWLFSSLHTRRAR